MVRSLEALWHQVCKAIAKGFDVSSKDILSSKYMFTNKVRQQLYSRYYRSTFYIKLLRAT